MRVLIDELRQGPELAPSVSVLEPGRNRFGFALFDRGNRQIGGLEVGPYVSRGLDETAHGPYVARYHPIEVEPQFRSQNSAEDPDSARSIYVAEAPFPRPGSYVVAGGREAERPAGRRASPQVMVGATARSRARATARSACTRRRWSRSAATSTQIETRVPPDTMHEVDLADALDARPPGGAAVRHARALREPRLRPGHGRRRAGEVRVRRRRRLHPHGDLQRQRPEEGRRGRSSARGACASEPCCSRSSADGRIVRPASRARSRPTSCATRCAGRCAERLRAGSRRGASSRGAGGRARARPPGRPASHRRRASRAADVARIAKRVERLRGLRFERPVRPLFLDRDEAVELVRADRAEYSEREQLHRRGGPEAARPAARRTTTWAQAIDSVERGAGARLLRRPLEAAGRDPRRRA